MFPNWNASEMGPKYSVHAYTNIDYPAVSRNKLTLACEILRLTSQKIKFFIYHEYMHKMLAI